MKQTKCVQQVLKHGFRTCSAHFQLMGSSKSRKKHQDVYDCFADYRKTLHYRKLSEATRVVRTVHIIIKKRNH